MELEDEEDFALEAEQASGRVLFLPTGSTMLSG